MSAKRIFLALLIAGGVATGAAFFANSGSNAADTGPIDHAQHMAGIAAELPTMPGQEIFGTIQEIVWTLATDPATDWSKSEQY